MEHLAEVVDRRGRDVDQHRDSAVLRLDRTVELDAVADHEVAHQPALDRLHAHAVVLGRLNQGAVVTHTETSTLAGCSCAFSCSCHQWLPMKFLMLERQGPMCSANRALSTWTG